MSHAQSGDASVEASQPPDLSIATISSPIASQPLRPARRREAARWGVSFVIVVALHVAIAAWLFSRAVQDAPNDSASDAVLIDLPPLVATAGAPAPAQPTDTPKESANDSRETPPATVEATSPEPEVALPDSAPDASDTLAALAPQAVVEPTIVHPPADAVVLPAPVERPAPQPMPQSERKPLPKPQRLAEKPKPKPVVRRPERNAETDRPAARRASSGSAGSQAAQSRSGASEPVAESAASLASWRARVAAHLQRFKRYPGDAQARGERGTARVTFTMNRSGHVLSVRLTGSSGSPTLDAASTDMVRRAEPLPAPPPDVRGVSFPFAVPVSYTAR